LISKELTARLAEIFTNDVGVILLPNGARVAIAVYVKGSARDLETRERIIARIAKATFDS
jgi:beta-lactamase class A